MLSGFDILSVSIMAAALVAAIAAFAAALQMSSRTAFGIGAGLVPIAVFLALFPVDFLASALDVTASLAAISGFLAVASAMLFEKSILRPRALRALARRQRLEAGDAAPSRHASTSATRTES